jgi:CubicO group peptidase (beta-lactamase class C family)
MLGVHPRPESPETAKGTPMLPARLALVTLTLSMPAHAEPYDFADLDALLNAELTNLNGNVTVLISQNGVEVYRFQAGDIDEDTRTRLASFTKTISAGVILSLADDGTLDLTQSIGDALPQFAANGLGEATLLDCWAMRHGIEPLQPYHRSPNVTLEQSVHLIAATGTQVFPPATRLGYDGAGMQATGLIATQRTGLDWESLARARIFDRCAMPQADYQQFDPNPAVAGGLRSTARETMNYAQMILDGGVFDGQRVLSENAVETMFTNFTRDLPVYFSPFDAGDPDYPYGQDPDYGFGTWVFAQNPGTGHVEEILGAGAWGSFIWIDRRRSLTAVLITDVMPTTQASRPAAFGTFGIARAQVETNQVTDLTASARGPDIRLVWRPAAGSLSTRVYASETPIRDVFDLRDATVVAQVSSVGGTTGAAVVPAASFYAVTAVFPDLENTALVPGGNSLDEAAPAPCPADLAAPFGVFTFGDISAFLGAFTNNDPRADLAAPLGAFTFGDVSAFLAAFGAGCP